MLHQRECKGLTEEGEEKQRRRKRENEEEEEECSGKMNTWQTYLHITALCALLPLSVELEGVKDGWSLLPQVPQVNAVVSQSTHQRTLP